MAELPDLARTEPSPERTTATAWRAAHDYDAWFERAWGAYAFSIEADTITHATPNIQGLDVLDVGCGTGRFAQLLETRGAHVTGIDREPAMLAVARARLHAPLVIGDALTLPFRDHAADLTLAVTILEFVPDPADAVAELACVTRTGGRIVIGALNPKSPWGWAQRHDLSQPPWSDARFLTRSGLRALARPYGPARLHAALYAPGAFPGLHTFGPFLETLGRAAPKLGAFQLLVIDTR